MARNSFRRTILRRWKLYKRLGTDDTVMAVVIQTETDKNDIRKMLFEENDPNVKHILNGDAVILTPDGFVVEHFIPFLTSFRRI
jgi:hypothetical protein